MNNVQAYTLLNYMFFLFLLFVAFYYSVLANQTGKMLTFNIRIKYFMPFFFWVLIKSILSSYFGDNIISLNLITNFMLMFVLTITINSINDFEIGIISMALGALPSAIIPLISRPDLIGQRIIEVGDESFIGGFWNGPMISFITIGWILIALAQRKNISRKWKMIFLSISILTFFAGFAGLSRALLLATGVAFIIVFVFSNNIKNRLRLLILLILGFILLNSVMPEVVSNLLNRITMNSSIGDESRMYIWKSYLANIKEYFYFGAFPKYRLLGPTAFTAGPHSVALNWLVQFGILGLIGFVYLLWGILSEILQVFNNKRMEGVFLLAWLFSYLALSMIGETGFFEMSAYAGFVYVLNWDRFLSESESKLRG